MKISNYLKKDFCIMELQSSKKEETIREIALSLVSSGKVTDEDKFIADILEREKLGSTGIGNGVAIPHSRTAAVKGIVMAFGRSKAGVEFKALDGAPVNLIFLMGTNPKELNLYLRFLAELSKLLMGASFRKELLAAAGQNEVIETFRKFEKR